MFKRVQQRGLFQSGILSLLAVFFFATFGSLLLAQSDTQPIGLPGTRAVTQQAKLRLPELGGGDPDSYFGTDVAISADGTTALIGAPHFNSDELGEFYIFIRSGENWSLQTTLFLETTGGRLALSADGNTALINGYLFRRSGSTWTQQIRFSAEGGFVGDEVALSDNGNTAVIASFNAEGAGSFTGAAFVFVYNGSTWTQQAKLATSDGEMFDTFGYSIDLSGDGNHAVIGAIDGDKAYVFNRTGTTWTEQAKLVPGNDLETVCTPICSYGRSVAMNESGDLALVGANSADQDAIGTAGAVYAFSRSGTTWTYQAKLEADDSEKNDEFGYSVDLSDNGQTAVIGARSVGDLEGAAYIFTRSGTTWTQRTRFSAPSPVSGYFGQSVEITDDGSMTLIASWVEDTAVGESSGAVYLFAGSGATWIQEEDFAPPYIEGEGEARDQFGYSAAMSADGNIAAIGVPYDDTELGQDVGAVFIYTRSGSNWTQQAKLRASETTETFGSSVEMSNDGNTLVISSVGAAFVYTRSGTSWSQQAKITAPDPVAGFGVATALSGNGDTILVGTAEVFDSVVYVYKRSGGNWNLQGELQTPEAGVDDWFGVSVTLSDDGDTALIGAPQASSSNPYTGASYSFTRSSGNWSGATRIDVVDPKLDGSFAQKVVLSGDGNTALITSSKAVYRFTRSGSSWIQQSGTVLIASSSDTERAGAQVIVNNIPGLAVSPDGTIALAGMIEYTFISAFEPPTKIIGTAYRIMFNGTASTVETIAANDVAPRAEFGYAVAGSQDLRTMLIGAPQDTLDTGEAAGSAQIYILNEVVVTPTPTDTGEVTLTPTPTQPAGTQLVQNGGFEGVTLAPWKVQNGIGDKLKCKLGEPIAHSGACAFQFKNKGNNSGVLSQKLDGETLSLSAGDTVTLSLYVRSKQGAEGKAKVVFKHGDDSETKITLNLSNTSGEYQQFVDSKTLQSGDVEKVKLTIKSVSASGKLYIDDISLIAADTGKAVFSLP